MLSAEEYKKWPMGYAGISALAKKQNLSVTLKPRKKIIVGRYTSQL